MKSVNWSLVVGLLLLFFGKQPRGTNACCSDFSTPQRRNKKVYFPSLTLGLLTTLLGLTGTINAVSAAESSATSVDEPLQLQNPVSSAESSATIVDEPLQLQNPVSSAESSSTSVDEPLQLQNPVSVAESSATIVDEPLQLQNPVQENEVVVQSQLDKGDKEDKESNKGKENKQDKVDKENKENKENKQDKEGEENQEAKEDKNQQPNTNNQPQITNNLKIEITAVGDPRIPADGRSTLTLQGRITNEQGELITQDAVVTLTSSAGKIVGADEDKDQPGFQVIARGGVFTARLQSGLEAQKVQVRAAVEKLGKREGKKEGDASLIPNPQISITNFQSSLETYTQVEFITNLRPSISTGSVNLRIGAAGVNFLGRRRDFLNPDEIKKGTQVNLTGAVFATGKVGEWLFTGAYNSDRALNETCDGATRLFRGPQFCEQQYPVYGDSSTIDYLTPSTDSVYVRLERTSPVRGAESDYIMWGDYNTQELARSSQLFTSTTRQLHGFKGNFNFGNLQVTALYSNSVEGFQRDTIAPNGTSGYYFLSRRIIVPGSENLFIETEENNRPGTVISRQPLNRNSDYEIDYDRGTIMFRRPMLATEFNPFATAEGSLLVKRIVATYQYDNPGGDTRLYGGRLQYNLSQDFASKSWVGGTYLREDQGAQDFELYGADFRFPLGAKGEFIGEYAHSKNRSLFLGRVTGSAYRLEANTNIAPGFFAQAFYRSVEENFANNATTSFSPGQTRYGASLAYKVSPTTLLQAGYDHEVNFGVAPLVRTGFFDLFNPGIEAAPGTRVSNSLTTIRAGIEQKLGVATLGVDYVNRSREDRVSRVFTGDASQIVSRLAVPITEALTFRAQDERNFGKSDPLYPNRTTLGMDWAVHPGVTMRLAHQFFDGGLLGNNSITSLDTILERKIGENTSVTGRYSLLNAYNTVVGQGAVGLNHRWVISPGLRVNLGYEHTFSNGSIPTAAGGRFYQPYAIGQSGSSLALLGGDVYSVGVEYSDNPNFQASARFEHRTGSGNNNTVFSAAAAGKISPALTALFRYERANFANQLIEGLGDSSTLRLGLAYRDPQSDVWNTLLRYEYRKNPATIPETILIGSGTGATEHVVAMEAIYAPSWRWEFYGKGAMRYSATDTAKDSSNSSTVYLSQLRTSYRLGYRMDLAVEGRWIGQSSPGFNEFGAALEGGYYLTPDLRVAVGYSIGGVDDRDFSGYRSKGGPYFGLTLKVNELFGGFGRQRVAPKQEEEVSLESKFAIPSAFNPTSE